MGRTVIGYNHHTRKLKVFIETGMRRIGDQHLFTLGNLRLSVTTIVKMISLPNLLACRLFATVRGLPSSTSVSNESRECGELMKIVRSLNT